MGPARPAWSATTTATTAEAAARLHRLRRALVDRQHLGDLHALVALRGADTELGARGHGLVAGIAQHRDVQEGVAAPDHLDEAEALLGVEPFDDRVDRRTGGGGRRSARAAELPGHRRITTTAAAAEIAPAEIVVVEAATAVAEILAPAHPSIVREVMA